MSGPRRQASPTELPSDSSRSSSRKPKGHHKQKRRATVYDAVAGRVSTQGFIPSRPSYPSTRDTASSSTLPIPPDEVLFRQSGAPVRYEEHDIYWADRDLQSEQSLPGSDLLKALHAYSADFYSRSLGPQVEISQGSMDGSALIALGILMEELCKDALGDTGDLALVEGEDVHVEEADLPTSTEVARDSHDASVGGNESEIKSSRLDSAGTGKVQLPESLQRRKA